MKIKLLLLGAVSAGALATASLADSITVVSWGGGYTKSQVEVTINLGLNRLEILLFLKIIVVA